MQYSQQFAANNSNLAMNEQMKRSNINLSYGVINSTADGYAFDDHQNKRYAPQSPPKRHENSINEEDYDGGSHVIQMEKDTLKLRRDLQDALASKKQAESRILA